MGLGTAIMGGIGLAGSLLSSNAQKKAAKKAAEAAQFNPWNASNLFGSTTWDRQRNQIKQSLSPFAQGIADQLQGQAQAGLGSAWQAQGEALMGDAARDLMGAYQAAQGMGGIDPAFANSIMGGFADLFGRAAPQISAQSINPYMLGAAPQVSAQTISPYMMGDVPQVSAQSINPYMLGDIPQVSAQTISPYMMGDAPQISAQTINPYMLGDVPQVSAQNTAGVDMSGLFSSAGNNPYALEQMQMGRNLMGNSYQDVANQQLALMRQQAAPHEERATNSLMQRLFNQGRMGSTGGGRDIEAFARGLGEADLSRQLAANQFAEGLYGRDQALGANLFSGGAGLYQQGQGLAANIGANINAQNLARDQYNLGAGQFNSQLGLQAALANQGASMQAGIANMDAALRAAMANQSASLQTGTANMDAALRAAMANQGASLQAGTVNTDAALRAAMANQSASMQAGTANMDAALRAAMANQGAYMQAGTANMDAALRAAMANQGASLQAGTANMDAALRAAMANQSAAMQAGTANMDAALRAAMANQSASLQGNQQALAALTGGANFGLTQDQLNYSRANDRIARAEALFGFGNALGQVGMNQTANALSLLSGLAGQQNDLANLGIAAGGAQATAGANAGRFTLSAAGSPLGGFLQGLGGAYLSSDQAQNQIFNFMSKL